ncbi:MAG: short-chain dehydrogenase [Acidiferrobacteraceae bacterium]|nr:short-chain dehydrogenase [Acidiferrobacteraceae bacterium]
MNKNCVIAGVGSGNGASFARRFAMSGYRVAMLARTKDYIANLSKEIPNSYAVTCDMRDPAAVISSFRQIKEAIGSANVLVYNAGSGDWSGIEDTTADNFESSWRTNTLGLLVAAQQVLPDMKKAGRGDIVVIGATASLRGGANTTGFASAKAAQRSLSQSLARGLGPIGIHVSYVVIDGIIDIDRTRARMPDQPDEFFLKPDAIAETVYTLTEQHPSAWSFEIDLRPHVEKW